ncbi:MAG: hypothetical protein HZA63_14460 [Rhodocyclales bacterium]|nr:hypothetical protein [Rhodocyclales bacterium]
MSMFRISAAAVCLVSGTSAQALNKTVDLSCDLAPDLGKVEIKMKNDGTWTSPTPAMPTKSGKWLQVKPSQVDLTKLNGKEAGHFVGLVFNLASVGPGPKLNLTSTGDAGPCRVTAAAE